MPTYVYRCPGCLDKVELVQKISEKKAPTCERVECFNYSKEYETMLQPSSFVLKGPGWAKDGYGGKR